MKEKTNNLRAIESTNNELEVDLKEILNALLRNKKFITIFTTIFILLTGIKLLTSKKTWEGELQIVLSNKERFSSNISSAVSQLNIDAGGLGSLIGIDGPENQLKTEVAILKSPSILLPVFNLVKDERRNSGLEVENFKFKNWLKNNLDINLEKGTTVLNLTYKDKNKNIIIPVLKKISNDYQIYSGRDRKKGIEQGIFYLNKQIEKYKEKSLISAQLAQKFSIKHDLFVTESSTNEDGEDKIIKTNVEIKRVQAANAIRSADSLLKQMDKLKSEEETLLFLSKSIRSKEAEDFLKFITTFDLKLTDLRSKFKENDKSIQDILKRRAAAIDSFIKETYQVLKAKKSQAEASLIAVKRPEGVLLQYAALLDESARDLAIMRRLEDQLRILLLEEARASDPWELITEPTLMEDPNLSNKKVLLLSLISGIFFGSIFALILDRRKDLIYSENELINIFGLRPILRIQAEEKSHWKESLITLSKIINEKETKDNSALLIAGDISENYLKQIDADLNNNTLDNKAILTKEYFNFDNYNKKFILIQKGAITRKRLNEILDNLNLLTEDFDGWILLI